MNLRCQAPLEIASRITFSKSAWHLLFVAFNAFF
jgi:hypothetical protein